MRFKLNSMVSEGMQEAMISSWNKIENHLISYLKIIITSQEMIQCASLSRSISINDNKRNIFSVHHFYSKKETAFFRLIALVALWTNYKCMKKCRKNWLDSSFCLKFSKEKKKSFLKISLKNWTAQLFSWKWGQNKH